MVQVQHDRQPMMIGHGPDQPRLVDPAVAIVGIQVQFQGHQNHRRPQVLGRLQNGPGHDVFTKVERGHGIAVGPGVA